MAPKLIFLYSEKMGRETFDFCPLVKWGCDKCPFREIGCDGEADENIAFNLVSDGIRYILHPIKEGGS